MSLSAQPHVTVAGASLAGLATAIALRTEGCSVTVIERRTPSPGAPQVVYPVPLKSADAEQLSSWISGYGMRADAVSFGAGAGYLLLDRLWAELLERCQQLSVEVVWERRVLGAQADRGRIAAVRTDAGPLPTDVLIIAAGAEAVAITPSLGLQLPVIPEFSAWWPLTEVPGEPGWRQPTSQVGESESIHAPCLWADGRGGGVVGVYRSFGVAGERRDYLARGYLEWVLNQAQSPARADGELLWRRHPHTSADHQPVVGRAPRLSNLVFALPHGAFGNAAVAVMAKAAAEAARLAIEGMTGADDSAWSPQRFPQGATGGRMEAAR